MDINIVEIDFSGKLIFNSYHRSSDKCGSFPSYVADISRIPWTVAFCCGLSAITEQGDNSADMVATAPSAKLDYQPLEINKRGQSVVLEQGGYSTLRQNTDYQTLDFDQCGQYVILEQGGHGGDGGHEQKLYFS